MYLPDFHLDLAARLADADVSSADDWSLARTVADLAAWVERPERDDLRGHPAYQALPAEHRWVVDGAMLADYLFLHDAQRLCALLGRSIPPRRQRGNWRGPAVAILERTERLTRSEAEQLAEASEPLPGLTAAAMNHVCGLGVLDYPTLEPAIAEAQRDVRQALYAASGREGGRQPWNGAFRAVLAALFSALDPDYYLHRWHTEDLRAPWRSVCGGAEPLRDRVPLPHERWMQACARLAEAREQPWLARSAPYAASEASIFHDRAGSAHELWDRACVGTSLPFDRYHAAAVLLAVEQAQVGG